MFRLFREPSTKLGKLGIIRGFLFLDPFEGLGKGFRGDGEFGVFRC